jgi:RNA polymerase sigma factor (TIGR02999 family)
MDAPITSLMASADSGDPAATNALFTVLYGELHRLAQRELARTNGPASIGPTTLLHESYLNMSKRDGSAFVDRGRFMAYAARVMRGLIIDYVRNRQAQKRGGGFEITSLDFDVADPGTHDVDLSRMTEALDELASFDPALARVVDFKFFCGLTVAEIATLSGVSERTVERQWERARIYLYRAIRGAPSHS